MKNLKTLDVDKAQKFIDKKLEEDGMVYLKQVYEALGIEQKEIKVLNEDLILTDLDFISSLG